MRYAILSDVHSNLPALEAVLNDVAEQHVDALLYLGDAVGYGAEPGPVIELLRTHCSVLECTADSQTARLPIWLAGNHEWGLLERAERGLFTPDALTALDRSRVELTPAQLELLAALPQRIDLQLDDGLIATLTHAAPTDPIGTLRYIDNEELAASDAQLLVGQLGLVGHTHFPRAFYEDGVRIGARRHWARQDLHEDYLPGSSFSFGERRAILNPGSVGQPRDGDPRAAYAVLETTTRSFTVRRVPYDIVRAQQRLRSWLGDHLPDLEGPNGLAGRLADGR